jgi:hypothetical protein
MCSRKPLSGRPTGYEVVIHQNDTPLHNFEGMPASPFLMQQMPTTGGYPRQAAYLLCRSTAYDVPGRRLANLMAGPMTRERMAGDSGDYRGKPGLA